MQYACAILSSEASPALLYFPTLCYKRYDLKKKVTEHKTCALIFPSAFV